MPRRAQPDPLALAVGARIRTLRRESGLTAEKLAFEIAVGSKGYLSDIEHGLALPSLTTLLAIARRLGVELFDLVTFPEASERARLVDRIRLHSGAEVQRIFRSLAGEEGVRARTRGTRASRGAEAVLRVAEATPRDTPRRARRR